MNQPHALLMGQHIPGGCHWSGIVRRGTTLRLMDVTGGANAAVLFFNQEEKLERYNMADTLEVAAHFPSDQGACMPFRYGSHFLLYYRRYRRLA